MEGQFLGKLDFVTNGIMEADRYYNPEVHTGVEAYNEGFAYFDMDWDEVEEDVATYERLKAKEAATV